VGGFVSALGGATAGLVALKLGLDALLSAVDKHLDERAAQQLKAEGIGSSLGIATRLVARQAQGVMTEQESRIAEKLVAQYRAAGVISSAGKVDRDALRRHVEELEEDRRADMARQLGMKYEAPAGEGEGEFGMLRDMNRRVTTAADIAGAMADRIAGLAGAFREKQRAVAEGGVDDRQRRTAGTVQNFYGDIHLNQKFEDTDPANVFVRFKEDLENARRRPVSSPFTDPRAD
jgi:hypothetical protein